MKLTVSSFSTIRGDNLQYLNLQKSVSRGCIHFIVYLKMEGDQMNQIQLPLRHGRQRTTISDRVVEDRPLSNGRGTMGAHETPSITVKHAAGGQVKETLAGAAYAALVQGASIVDQKGEKIKPVVRIICVKDAAKNGIAINEHTVGRPVQVLDAGAEAQSYILLKAPARDALISRAICRCEGRCSDADDNCVGCCNAVS